MAAARSKARGGTRGIMRQARQRNDSANTAVADGTSVYLRYEGNISGQDSAHALTAGVRMSW